MVGVLQTFAHDNSLRVLTSVQAQDPYLHTDGRWLHQDELQRKSRHVQFNFPRLCEIATELCDGASGVKSYEKKEGGYNRVFILTMDTGKRVVVRIPTSVAGPPRLTTNSEVATITYCGLFSAAFWAYQPTGKPAKTI